MLSLLGALIFLTGLIWLIVITFRLPLSLKMKIIWVLVHIISTPLGSVIFFIINRRGLIPMLLTILGFIVLSASLIITGNEVTS